ncbi:cytochrome c oxidase assembly factor CtaG [Priestia megaterium]|nr:cytochrome c oxidase assembly factor CtaG [Priestia megaterium]
MIRNLQLFGFEALWSPFFFVSLCIVTAVYFIFTGPLRYRVPNNEQVSVKTKAYFSLAMLLLYVCKGGPLDLLGHLMFSAHMTQMALVYLAIPPLMILGIPDWLARFLLHQKIIKPLFRIFTKPLIALLIFNGLFSLYHIPLIFDAVKTDMILHAAVSILLFIAAFCMWWPLLNQLDEHQTLSGIKKLGYIFANGMLLTPACALIIFADTSLYATYTNSQAWVNALALCVSPSVIASLGEIGPEMFNVLPPAEDQQLGGVIMKVIQEIVYGTILGYIFFQWVKKEREQDSLQSFDSKYDVPTHLSSH